MAEEPPRRTRSRSSSTSRSTPTPRTCTCPASASTSRPRCDAGATPQEIMEVLELQRHARHPRDEHRGARSWSRCSRRRACATGPAPLDEHQERLKAEFTATRGYWHSFWDEMLELDPELFEAYTAFSSVPGTRHARAQGQGVRLHRLRHLGDPPLRQGLKLHIENALGYGAHAAGDPRGHGDRQRARHPRGDHGVRRSSPSSPATCCRSRTATKTADQLTPDRPAVGGPFRRPGRPAPPGRGRRGPGWGFPYLISGQWPQ